MIRYKPGLKIGYKIVCNNYTSLRAEGKYEQHYLIGNTVKFIPGTLGIMIFDKIEHVLHFMWDSEGDSKYCKLLKVIYYEKDIIPTPLYISKRNDEKGLNLWYKTRPLDFDYNWEADIGTICCKQIKVLRELESIPWRWR